MHPTSGSTGKLGRPRSETDQLCVSRVLLCTQTTATGLLNTVRSVVAVACLESASRTLTATAALPGQFFRGILRLLYLLILHTKNVRGTLKNSSFPQRS